MTYKEKYESCETWQERAVIINLYHALQVAQRKHWTMRATAKYFGISLGHVSEDIKLAESISTLRNISTRKEALKSIK